MLPKDKAESFKLEDAISNPNSTRIHPNPLSNVSQALSTPVDAFGNQLDSSTEYVAKVLILAKGTYSLSNTSINSVQLRNILIITRMRRPKALKLINRSIIFYSRYSYGVYITIRVPACFVIIDYFSLFKT